jgi:hypothetical protein
MTVREARRELEAAARVYAAAVQAGNLSIAHLRLIQMEAAAIKFSDAMTPEERIRIKEEAARL